MAFTSGNIGKEILQRAMKQQLFRPKTAVESKKAKASDIATSERLERRLSDRKVEENSIQAILPYEDSLGEKYKCTCHVCQEKSGNKSKPFSALATVKPKTITSQGNEKGFSYLLRILIPDRGSAPKGLKFLIADTLVFVSGEPRFLVYNSRDKYIRFAKHKDRLSLPEMRKFFQGRKKRKELDGINFFNENTITMSKKVKDNAQKVERQQGQETPTMTQERSPTRKEKRVLETTAHKEIVICKYTDESLQVLSELDFSYLMMKRKIEAVWAQLDYIQTYIKLKKEHPYYIRVDFEYERDKKTSLYERARNYIYYLTEEKEPELEGFDYATEEDYFEEQLKEKNIYEYCQYLNFKFICYLDAYCATRIKEMVSEFAWEETNLVYLTNAYKIRFFNLDEIDDYMLKEIEIVNEEERQKALDKLYSEKTSPYQGKVEILWAFRQYYDGIKKEMGVHNALDDSVLENPTSNEAFRQINPETSFTLYDVMTDGKQFEKFKIWLKNRTLDPGSLAKLYKSALKYAENTTGFNAFSTTKSKKAIAIKQEKDKNNKGDNSAKAFLKKLKALDICGNGVSKKKYIHSTEILYRSDVHSGRRLVANISPKKHNITNPMSSPSHNHTSPQKGLSRADLGLTAGNRFKIRSPKPATQQNTLDQAMFNKTQSLASILYLKPTSSLK